MGSGNNTMIKGYILLLIICFALVGCGNKEAVKDGITKSSPASANALNIEITSQTQ